MAAKLTIAVPSKGRLKDQAAASVRARRPGLAQDRVTSAAIAARSQGLDGVEVVFLSAAEIVHQLEVGPRASRALPARI